VRAESVVELVEPPAFEVGQRVRVVRELRNDGTFAGRRVGDALVRAGEVGWVASVGEYLQQFYIYAVFLKERGYVVGCRARELEDAEEERP
jgi:nitrogen fixation protein NifZ